MRPDPLLTVGMAAIVATVMGAFLVVDFFAPFVFFRRWKFVGFILLGACISQLNLIAVWAALGPGNIVVRLPWALLLALLSWYAMVLGNRAAGHASFSLREALQLGVVWLVGVVVAQIPLWIASRAFGFRLVQEPPHLQHLHETKARGNQFHLRDLLLGMMLLSMALAPLRAVLPGDSLNGVFNVAPGWFAVLGGLAACNLLITLPCLWGAFLRAPMLLLFALIWPFYCALLTFLEVALLYGDILVHAETHWDFLLCNLSQYVTVTGVLLVFRVIYFRLVRVGRRRPA